MNYEHLLNCVYFKEGKHNKLQLEQIRNGDISDKIEVLEKLQEIQIKQDQNLTYRCAILGLRIYNLFNIFSFQFE